MRVLNRLKDKASPAMVVAVIAVVFAMTGSAFAARTLLTGEDIKDGTITQADLAPTAVSALKAHASKGKRGPRGPRGPRGLQGDRGPQGPEGLIGPQGERGPTGATGPAGPQGNPGSTGAKGAKGDTGAQGPQGDPGNDGAPGQSLVPGGDIVGGPTDVGTAVSSAGPVSGEGIDLSNGGIFLPAGQYKVDISVTFTDPAGDDSGLEYGVGRLFLDGSPLDVVNGDPFGGSSPIDTAIVTADIPDNGTDVAQASGSFIIQVADDGSGGETLTLVGAVRSAEAEGATGTGHMIVTTIG